MLDFEQMTNEQLLCNYYDITNGTKVQSIDDEVSFDTLSRPFYYSNERKIIQEMINRNMHEIFLYHLNLIVEDIYNNHIKLCKLESIKREVVETLISKNQNVPIPKINTCEDKLRTDEIALYVEAKIFDEKQYFKIEIDEIADDFCIEEINKHNYLNRY